MNWHGSQHLWLFSLVGGVIGAVLALLLLDWALIILSSLIGASLICQALPLQQAMSAICFIVIFAVGILVQSSFIRRPLPAV
jgi:ABC-type lipoprotein release transport system permease subunit